MKFWTIFGILIWVLVGIFVISSIVTNRAFWLFTIMYFVGCYYTLIALFGAFWETKKPFKDPNYRPFVTVMIPMKNEEEVISNTLKDLRGQFYHLNGKSRLEILAVDDGSTDNTCAVVEKLMRKWGNGTKHKLRLVRNRGEHHGKPAALNYGLKYATGEIICIDDGSIDSSSRIIDEYASRDPRILVISKTNSGYGASMNRGLEAATGEYIGICEPDDFADTHMFEEYFKAADRFQCDLVKSNYFEHSGQRDDRFIRVFEIDSTLSVDGFLSMKFAGSASLTVSVNIPFSTFHVPDTFARID